jgi:DNA-binding transcriptional regulator GbsR (MarR family)
MSPQDDWRALVLESIGRVIAFWGFKRNHGRLWALLYLHGEPLSATEIGRRLELSKGAVSMVTRELESWAVIRQVAGAGRGGVDYEAERDIWQMIRSVLERRELRLVVQVRDDLERAIELVSRDGTLPPAEREAVAKRIRALRRFAEAGRVAVEAFLRSRRLELRPLEGILARAKRD